MYIFPVSSNSKLHNTVKEALAEGSKKLRESGVDTPELEARMFLKASLGVDEAFLFAHPESITDEKARTLYAQCIERRLRNEPAAYILGEKEFYGRRFVVDSGVLIPRPETELLVEAALGIINLSQSETNVADVGTGSGCVAVTLALEAPGIKVTATDISQSAIETARLNAQSLGALGSVQFVCGDLLDPIQNGTIDVVVSNPPYVTSKEYEELSREIRDYEPRKALVAGKDGLKIIGRIIADSPRVLRRQGYLLLEIGFAQAEDVARLMEAEGFDSIETFKDLGGIARVVRGKVKGQWKR